MCLFSYEAEYSRLTNDVAHIQIKADSHSIKERKMNRVKNFTEKDAHR